MIGVSSILLKIPKTIIFIGFILITFIGNAQQVSANTKKKSYTIGDWVPIDLTVTAEINDKVFFPNFKKVDSSANGNIEIVNASEIDTVKEGINYRYHQLVNFICFDTGKILFQPFPIIVSNRAKLDTLYTDAVLVHVAGVAIDTTKDIKPIKGPIKVPYTFKELLPYLLIGLAILILLAFLIWFFKFRKKKTEPIDLKYILPPDVWATQALDKVEQKQLWQHGETKLYYSELSDILRSYIELRFNVAAMEQTTDEIMQSLHRGMLKQKLKQPINEFLGLSDFVKFAKAQPDINDNTNAIKTIRIFIDQTKPTNNETKDNNPQ